MIWLLDTTSPWLGDLLGNISNHSGCFCPFSGPHSVVTMDGSHVGNPTISMGWSWDNYGMTIGDLYWDTVILWDFIIFIIPNSINNSHLGIIYWWCCFKIQENNNSSPSWFLVKSNRGIMTIRFFFWGGPDHSRALGSVLRWATGYNPWIVTLMDNPTIIAGWELGVPLWLGEAPEKIVCLCFVLNRYSTIKHYTSTEKCLI